MTEHIKKFESAQSADNWIIDNPFIATIVGDGNLSCGDPNKKLINDNGHVKIIDNLILPIFTVTLSNGTIKQYNYIGVMSWEEFLSSNYNVDNWTTYDKSEYHNTEPHSFEAFVTDQAGYALKQSIPSKYIVPKPELYSRYSLCVGYNGEGDWYETQQIINNTYTYSFISRDSIDFSTGGMN